MAWLNLLLNRHAALLCKPCISSDLLTPPQEMLTGVKFGKEIHRDPIFTACIVYTMVVETMVVWDLKTCQGKQNVDLYRINVYRMYKERIPDFTNTWTYPEY